MLEITKQSTLNSLSDAQITLLRKQWKENRAIVLPGLIEPSLLSHVRRALERGEFHKIKHSGVDATELTLKHGPTINLLEMLVSEPTFSDVISKITEKKPLGYFQGRVYNISKSDHDDWHQDDGYDYLMAMSINLSPKPYKGGSLKLRDKKTKKQFCDIQNIGPGDALIFNISKTLEHKITPVTGRNPKIAFAGWFCPKPTYQNYMSKIIHKVIKKSKMIPKAAVSDKPSELPRVSKSVAFRCVGTKTLLIDLRDDSEYVLNGMGSKIWKSLCNREECKQTISTLQKTYKLDFKTLETEYQELIEELLHVGLLNGKQAYR